MFDKILIANRGEIACRVIRTARRLGVGTVAVYSDADAGALHVELADEAVRIGPPPAAESYLVQRAVLDAALRTGAQAIHPGYGFLSENSTFARACRDAGIVFIGPPAEAIEAMGSKSAAKELMEKAGVPVVPGDNGGDQDPAVLAAAADRIGYPVLIKASAGGGGKGMRLVTDPKQFAAALEGAKREAANAFGDDHCLVEKFVSEPRHIEVQVFADTQGNAVHLFERDCSVQRRHQKVLEEAPAPGLDPEVREAMGKAAVDAAKAIGYVGAGTVEFISSAGQSFYFMEMNTRLQVEHPVTELVTGQDLVEWQLRVASGEPLPLAQDDLAIGGHALEARLYAEDPARDFLPASGTLLRLALPAGSDNGPVRVDAGVREGDTVTPYYDPMIAKLIAWGKTRDAALQRMRRMLRETQVAGLASNAAFLGAVVAHEEFAAGGVDTGFLDRHPDLKGEGTGPVPAHALAAAALVFELVRAEEMAEEAARSSDPFSPWATATGWRLNDYGSHRFSLQSGQETHDLVVTYRDDAYLVAVDGAEIAVGGELDWDGEVVATVDGRQTRLGYAIDRHTLWLFLDGASYVLTQVDPMTAVEDMDGGDDRLVAPMSGKVIKVFAEPGATLEAGEPILILEAMKMEHTIAAPADGTLNAVHFGEGDQVDEGDELVDFEAKEA